MGSTERASTCWLSAKMGGVYSQLRIERSSLEIVVRLSDRRVWSWYWAHEGESVSIKEVDHDSELLRIRTPDDKWELSYFEGAIEIREV